MVEWMKPPWDSGRRKVFLAERKHEGAAPWSVPVGGGLLLGIAVIVCYRKYTVRLLSESSTSTQSNLGTVYEQPGL